MPHDNTPSVDEPQDIRAQEPVIEPIPAIASQTPLAYGVDDDAETQTALRNLEERRRKQKRKRRIKIIVGSAIATGILAVAVGHFFGTGSNAETDEEFVPETAVVERRNFESVVSSSGALKAGSTVVVTPEVDGTIESVHVKEGDTVQEGDILFTLKNDELDKAVRDAAKEVTTAERGVSSAQDGVTQAIAARDDAWDRYHEAWNEVDRAHREWEQLKSNYDSMHEDWEVRMAAAEALACGQPQDPGKEPKNPGEEPKEEDYPDQPDEFEAKHEEWQRKKDAYDTWMGLY